MNKHDELIAELEGVKWVMDNVNLGVGSINKAIDLLQLYGDALEAIAADKDCSNHTTCGCVKANLAQKTVEVGYIEEHAEITKEQWDSIKTTVEGE